MARKPANSKWGADLPSRDEMFQVKRRALIREAGKSFSRLGYHNASLDDVARALHVSKPALYYYVKDKNEILFECHNFALDLGDRAMEEARAAQATAFGRLREFVFRYVHMINGELGSYAVLTEPATSLREPERQAILKRRRQFDSALRQWVNEAIADGDIADNDPGLVVAFFMGAINQIPLWFNPEGPIPGEQVARIFSNLISCGMRGERGNAPPGRG
ncbi:TetR/AcrR family transcriptional regulator [Bordetella bronchiseptica]|uniref:TetR/AcrR family transcriptional regulator n=1 Tax=Bordetella bronchiseptica TaxID=518 RepID=UPI0004A06694|nr:TetR/AcrR family transcriptional regulator [Bordetella bronchiseptica]KDC66175.1 transcriptional regulator, TetR family [Bordetella bronchiseptica MBORD624]WLS58011.1 TetR/AcrR family transcriptional regulator [Bordetella bronchiseptica]WLS62844.1 TetR/AcrR family transcriptional regulator [Bordetella bronchiseptica]